MNIQEAIRQKIEQVEAIIAKKNREIAQRDCRIARLEHELKYALGVAALHGPAQERVAQLEDEVAMLTHPHDLAAYRAKKTLHK